MRIETEIAGLRIAQLCFINSSDNFRFGCFHLVDWLVSFMKLKLNWLPANQLNWNLMNQPNQPMKPNRANCCLISEAVNSFKPLINQPAFIHKFTSGSEFLMNCWLIRLDEFRLQFSLFDFHFSSVVGLMPLIQTFI